MNIHPIQLFDPVSSTCTHILAAPGSAEAVIIDPVGPTGNATCAISSASACRTGFERV